MILLSFAGFLRFDEVSSLLCSDVKIECEYLFLFIRKSKTDQYRNGNEVECRPSFNPLETNLNLETILSLAAV
jgi:hypothetical protein